MSDDSRCFGPNPSSNWWDDLKARDLQVLEDGKQLQRHYEAREARAEGADQERNRQREQPILVADLVDYYRRTDFPTKQRGTRRRPGSFMVNS